MGGSQQPRRLLAAFGLLLLVGLTTSTNLARADDPAAKDMTATTLAQRLLSAKYVGLARTGPERSAYNIDVYSPEEYKHKLQGKTELDALRRKHHVEDDLGGGGWGGGGGHLVGEAQEEQKAYQTELQKIRDKYGMGSWEISFVGGTAYCRVIAVGQDYLELQDSASNDRTFLLPLRLVARVNMPRPEPATAPKP